MKHYLMLFVPEGPELFGICLQVLVFPGLGGPPAVPHPHVITSICQNEAQAVAGQIGDPAAGRCKQTMLQVDNKPLS